MKIKSKSYVQAIDHEGQQYQRQSGSTWFKVVGDTLEGVYGREEHRLERAYQESKYANQVKEDAGAEFDLWLQTTTTCPNQSRHESGYANYEVDLAWRAWQAARVT